MASRLGTRLAAIISGVHCRSGRCLLIVAGEVFLMNRQPPDFFDGRYFEPLPTTTIVGRADPLWTQVKLGQAAMLKWEKKK
jgi:type IV secretory pathway protease TraF